MNRTIIIASITLVAERSKSFLLVCTTKRRINCHSSSAYTIFLVLETQEIGSVVLVLKLNMFSLGYF